MRGEGHHTGAKVWERAAASERGRVGREGGKVGSGRVGSGRAGRGANRAIDEAGSSSPSQALRTLPPLRLPPVRKRGRDHGQLLLVLLVGPVPVRRKLPSRRLWRTCAAVNVCRGESLTLAGVGGLDVPLPETLVLPMLDPPSGCALQQASGFARAESAGSASKLRASEGSVVTAMMFVRGWGSA